MLITGTRNDGASIVTIDTAVVDGTLEATNSVFGVQVYYGLSDGGTNPAAWDATQFIASYSNVTGQAFEGKVLVQRTHHDIVGFKNHVIIKLVRNGTGIGHGR